MFAPSSPSSANSVLLLLTTAVILVASAAVASPVSREEQNALEQPGRTHSPLSQNAIGL